MHCCPTAQLRERLYSRLMPDPATGCLLWTGYVGDDGYGRTSVNGRTRLVHRVIWELDNGPVPDGLQLDHVKARGCAYRHCANVAHLEPVTQWVNLLRGETIVAVCAAKESCGNGHEFDLFNTYWTPGGRRQCRACRAAAARDFRRRNPGKHARATAGR